MKQFVLLSMVAILAASAGPTRAAESSEEIWYIVSLQGQPAGWAVTRERNADGRITSAMTMHIAVARGQTPMEIEIGTTFVETEAGRAIKASTVQDLAIMAKRIDLTFEDDGIEMVTTQNGRSMKRTLPPIEGDWMTPSRAEKYVMERIEAGETEISYRTFDPSSSMQPIDVRVKVDGPTTIESFGKTVPATKVRTSVSLMPGMETVSYIDDEGRPIRTSVDAGFVKMDMVRADKDLAQAQKAPPELLNASLVTPDRPIHDPRGATKASYVLRATEGELPDLAETPVQRFERIDKRTARVTITAATTPTDAPPPAVERSSVIDGRDEQIVALKDEAVSDTGDAPAARAEAMRRFVHQYIDEKNLNVGLATASETARTKQGDCTEHAVLLAALLRADGIPARTASGLIYVDQALGHREIFGYHMWTQAWLGGRWVDLDATLGPATPFDATHITLTASDMDDATWTNDLVKLAPLMGRLSIEVESVE